MPLEIEGSPELNRWINDNPLGARSIEVMLEALPDLHIAFPMGPPFSGLVNLPKRQILYNPDLSNPVVVYETTPTDSKDEPGFVIGADGTVIDLQDIENRTEYVGADELRKRMEEG